MVGFRPNLQLDVERTANEPQKRQQLTRLLDQVVGTGIVYASTIRQVDLLHDMLGDLGFRVAKDHARMSFRQRQDGRDAFMAGAVDALVATGAFGASVEKRDIGFIIHYSTPGSLAEYHREIAVAGRGGEIVRCVLLYHEEDGLFFGGGRYPTREEIRAVNGALDTLGAARAPVTLMPLHEAAGVPPAETRVVLAVLKDLGVVKEYRGSKFSLLQPDLAAGALDEMASEYLTRHAADHREISQVRDYALTGGCRWKVLLEYLDEDADWGHCGTCDNCLRWRAQHVAPADELSETEDRPPTS